jgi:hypothetical protein
MKPEDHESRAFSGPVVGYVAAAVALLILLMA